MLLSRLFKAAASSPTRADAPAPEYPLELEERLNRVHSRASVRQHLEILYGDLKVGGEPFVDLYFRCLERTGTAVTPFNVFQRFQTRHDLVRYFLASHHVSGARVECGAYRGATALLLAHVWRSIDPAFSGSGLYLVDSFTGTMTSTGADLIPVRAPSGAPKLEPFFPPGKSDVTASMVRAFFQEFPDAAVLTGWVPSVLAELDQERFAFVHVDLTLHEATYAALEYFYPRMSPGGFIFCDGSLFCPGVEKAVERYSDAHDVPYVVLGHRQYVLTKS
jgi:O-methyltransferase